VGNTGKKSCWVFGGGTKLTKEKDFAKGKIVSAKGGARRRQSPNTGQKNRRHNRNAQKSHLGGKKKTPT